MQGMADQLLRGMFVNGPMRMGDEVSQEAVVNVLLDFAYKINE